MNAVCPRSISRDEKKGLTITWSDASQTYLPCAKLRAHCPCATCRMERGDDSHDAPLTPKKKSSLKIIEHSSEESLALMQIWSIGNYALGLKWADGHDSGIYTYELLHELGVS